MAATRFTLITGETQQDVRMNYYRAAMRLALEKTRPDYGDYELLDAIRMNKARMRLEVQTPGKNALFIVDSWPQEIPQPGVTLVPSPSIWACSATGSVLSAAPVPRPWPGSHPVPVAAVHARVGTGWRDADILRYNGFRVQEVDNYESLFRLVARGRIDLFCRGANEILSEWKTTDPACRG